jgi:VanZ family protein
MNDSAGTRSEIRDERRAGFSVHSIRLAWILALAYLLVVAYASLKPFGAWRMPPDEILQFLTAPWPRYITLEDIAVNVAAYVPLGFLLSAGLGARYGAAPGALAATFAVAGVSLAMEALQMFLPSRIASNVDLLTNGCGGLIGAMAAPLFAPTRLVGRRLHAWRHRVFRGGMAADAGFVIVCLWLLAQLNPVAQLFGTGEVRGVFELPVYFAHSPQRVLSTEAAVVFLNLVALGLILTALMRPAARCMTMIAVVVGAGASLKAAAAVFAKSAHPLVWLTPGVSFGLVGGGLAVYALSWLPGRARLAVAALCIVAATTAINVAPDNPYQNIPARLIAGGTSHYLSFSGIVRALSELWPLLAILYLGFALAEPRREESHKR